MRNPTLLHISTTDPHNMAIVERISRLLLSRDSTQSGIARHPEIVIGPLAVGLYCYRHNLTGPEDGPRATWAEGDHRGDLRIGFCVSVLKARIAVYLVRIV
jgi:hypothetical protein